MTTVATAARPVALTRAYRFELVKLLAQWRVRLLLVACWIGPGVAVAGVSMQTSLPTDTLFGRWMNVTGWASPLVLLGFAGSYALPLLTSVIAGDVFAAEDRLGTWRHLLVAVRSYRRIFLAKTLASVTVIVLLVVGMAVSSTLGGLAVIGNQPLVGLDGHLIEHPAASITLSWLCALAPTLALAALGLLGSVALGRSPFGLLLPAVVALGMAVVQMLPLSVPVRLALPTYAFVVWSGLFTEPVQYTPLLIGIVVSLVWAVVATALAYRLFRRRDFTNLTGEVQGALSGALLPMIALPLITIAVLTPVTGPGITRGALEQSLATEFAHLYRMQTDQLHRDPVTEAQVAPTAACTKADGLGAQTGPGNDWRCVVTWHLPDTTATGQAIYQLDVTSDGRFVADGDGPKEVNGYFLVHTDTGDQPNPLWQFDGNVELD